MAGNLRSPRKRAEEIGTDRSKFSSSGDYDPAAGCPRSHPGHGGDYADNTEGARPVAGNPPAGPKPI